MIAWWALSAGLAIAIYTLIDKKHVNNSSGKKITEPKGGRSCPEKSVLSVEAKRFVSVAKVGVTFQHHLL